MYLVFERPKQKRRPRFGPIVIEAGIARINVVDGRASTRCPPPPARGQYPKEMPCSVCGETFMANSGGAAYCSKDCQRERVAERRMADEMEAMMRRPLRGL